MALTAAATERVQWGIGTGERDLARERAARTELAERIVRHVAEEGRIEAAPGLYLFRYSSPTGPLYSVSEPSFCVVVQGSKELFLGGQRYRYDASRYLLVSAEVVMRYFVGSSIIWVTEVSRLIRIRTGEEGADAV